MFFFFRSSSFEHEREKSPPALSLTTATGHAFTPRLKNVRRRKRKTKGERGEEEYTRKKKTAQLTGRRRPRDDLAPKVVGARERARQQLADRRRLGDVDPHRRDVRRLGRALGVDAQHRRVDPHRAQRVALDLFGKLDDAAGAVDLHHAEGLGVLLLAGQGGDGDIGSGGAVGGDEGGVFGRVPFFFRISFLSFFFSITRRARPRDPLKRKKKNPQN